MGTQGLLIDSCKSVEEAAKTTINLKDILNMKSLPQGRLDGGFTHSVIMNIPYGEKEILSVIKKIPRSLATDVALRTQYLAKGDALEDKYVSCQYEGDDIYVLKTLSERMNLCPTVKVKDLAPSKKAHEFLMPQFRLENGQLRGDLGQLPQYLPLVPVIKKKKDSTTYLLKIDNTHNARIKVVPFDKIPMRELRVSQVFSKSLHGPQVFGCFFIDKKVYLAAQEFEFPLSESGFLQHFQTMSQAARCGFYNEMIEVLLEFTLTKYVHNDVRPKYYILDKTGAPRLVHYKYTKIAGGIDGEIHSPMFACPLRLSKKVADSFNDVYSGAATIVAMESPLGEGVFDYKWGTDIRLDPKTFPRMPSATETTIRDIVLGTLEATWGAYDPNEKNYNKMNLTTLIMGIMVGLDTNINSFVLSREMARFSLQLKKRETQQVI